MGNHQFKKYLLYASGEIVLVVVGILIALSINGRYNRYQNEQKFKNILTQMQKELLVDIKDASRIFDVKIGKDSIARKVFSNSINNYAYKENRFQYDITDDYVSFSNQKGAYALLMNNLEGLPETYDLIIPFLNDLYVEKQNDIDDYNEVMKKTVMENNRFERFQKPEHADYLFGNLTEEEGFQYFVEDPFLKNRTLLYMSDLELISSAANDYRIEAIELHQLIDSLLGKKNQTEIPELNTLPDNKLVSVFLGAYVLADDPEGTHSLDLKIENDHLVLEHSRGASHLFWHKDNIFYQLNSGSDFRLLTNEQNQRIIRYSNAYQNGYMTHKDDLKP